MSKVIEATFVKITWNMSNDNKPKIMWMADTDEDDDILDIAIVANNKIPDGGYIISIEDAGTGFSIVNEPTP